MYPEPYLEYLIQFHAERDYFECHEILEEYWKSAPANEREPMGRVDPDRRSPLPPSTRQLQRSNQNAEQCD